MSDTVLNFYRVTPRKAREFILDCFYANLVPFVRSSPGMGKSRLLASVADELNLHMIDHRLSTSEPTDMSGLPHFTKEGYARFAPFQELFPLQETPIPEDRDGWMINFDEFNSAPKAVMAAAYKVLLDRYVGQHHLHENVVIACAGNLDTDRAITNPIGTALQSRVVHIELEISTEEWMEDVALKQGYDSRIIAFLSQYPTKLMDFRPDHNNKTFCCPRTWEFLDRLIKGKQVSEGKTALYAGTITPEIAVEFVQFTKVYGDMITIREILADPHGAKLPDDNSTRWAIITHMMEKMEPKIFEDLATYANRFPLDFRILFYRSILIRYPELRRHSAFGKVQSDLAKYIYAT
jgi:hypothetical protein